MKFDASGVFSNSTKVQKAAVRRGRKTEKSEQKKQPPKNDVPPAFVQTSSTSASSVSVLEYSMPLNYVGKKITFQMCVKIHLFPLVKFLPHGDDDTNLDYSLDATTVCGFLCQHCGVSEQDAPNWWKEQRKNLWKTLTDFRNNRIKEMQKRFLGKCVLNAVCNALQACLLTLTLMRM